MVGGLPEASLLLEGEVRVVMPSRFRRCWSSAGEWPKPAG